MKRTAKVEFFQNCPGGFWYWHLKSANGRIICQGESHTSLRDARRAWAGVKRAAATARTPG